MNQKNSQTSLNSNDEFIQELQGLAADGCEVPREFVKDIEDHNFATYIAALFRGGFVDPIIFEDDYSNSDNQSIKFPCPRDGNMITCADCFDCCKSKCCDIYATMLDENNN